MRDALFDAEVVVFGAFVPVAEFGDGECGADEQNEDGPLAAAAGGGCIGWFCFGCIQSVYFIAISPNCNTEYVRNASNVFRLPCADFSPNASSSRPFAANPFITNRQCIQVADKTLSQQKSVVISISIISIVEGRMLFVSPLLQKAELWPSSLSALIRLD